jgi:hypothetical protein
MIVTGKYMRLGGIGLPAMPNGIAIVALVGSVMAIKRMMGSWAM